MFKRLGERGGWSSMRRGGGLCTLQALSGEGRREETVLPWGMSSIRGLWSPCSATVWLLPWETRSKEHMEHCLGVACMCSHHRGREINQSNSLIPPSQSRTYLSHLQCTQSPLMGMALAEFGWGQITWTASTLPPRRNRHPPKGKITDWIQLETQFKFYMGTRLFTVFKFMISYIFPPTFYLVGF